MIQSARWYTLWCTVLLLSLSAARAMPGTITEQVPHATEHTAIPDAVVWAEPVGAMPAFPPPAQPAEMAQGLFTLPHVPAGEYTVQVWHERLRGESQTVTVTASGTTTVSLALRPTRQGE